MKKNVLWLLLLIFILVFNGCVSSTSDTKDDGTKTEKISKITVNSKVPVETPIGSAYKYVISIDVDPNAGIKKVKILLKDEKNNFFESTKLEGNSFVFNIPYILTEYNAVTIKAYDASENEISSKDFSLGDAATGSINRTTEIFSYNPKRDAIVTPGIIREGVYNYLAGNDVKFNYFSFDKMQDVAYKGTAEKQSFLMKINSGSYVVMVYKKALRAISFDKYDGMATLIGSNALNVNSISNLKPLTTVNDLELGALKHADGSDFDFVVQQVFFKNKTDQTLRVVYDFTVIVNRTDIDDIDIPEGDITNLSSKTVDNTKVFTGKFMTDPNKNLVTVVAYKNKVEIERKTNCPIDKNVVDVPTTLTATAGDGKAFLKWNISSNASGFKVYSVDKATKTYKEIYTGKAALTDYVVQNLVNGTTYNFVVTALNGAGESGYSNEVSVTPNTNYAKIISVTPDNGLVDGTNTQFTIVVEYNLISFDSGDINIGFNNGNSISIFNKLLTETVGKGKAQKTLTVKAKVKDWKDEGTFRIMLNFSKTGTFSSISNDMYTLYIKNSATGLYPPSRVDATKGKYTDKIIVDWTAVSGAASYNVYRANYASAAPVLLGNVKAPNVTYTDSTALKGVTYYYFITAIGSDNKESEKSNFATGYLGTVNNSTLYDLSGTWVFEMTLEGEGVQKFSGIFTKNGSDSKYKLLMKNFGDVGDINFEVDYSSGKVTLSAVVQGEKGSLVGDVVSSDSIVNGKSYGDNGQQTDVTWFAYRGTTTTLTAPTNVTASKGTYPNKIVVDWTSVTGATGYKIYRANYASAAPVYIATVNAPVVTYTDTNVVKGLNYNYFVTAIGSNNAESAKSTAAVGYLGDVSASEIVIYQNGNIGGVDSGPKNPTVFTITSAAVVTSMQNYHYFNKGVLPGTIALKHEDGTLYGPWQTYGTIGQGNVANAYWNCTPNVKIKAGKYTVIDSDPLTWSCNSQSNNCGFTIVKGYYDNSTVVLTDPNGDWKVKSITSYGTTEADMMVRTGDIDNLGFGWPTNFDPFSGNTTPAHGFPFTPEKDDPLGTDTIMVVTSYDGTKGSDGYTSSTQRPNNAIQTITLKYNLQGITVRDAILQLFVDDFQHASYGALYTVTINGTDCPFIADVLNSIDQTGPVGKMVTIGIPSEYLNLVKSGALAIKIDDLTTKAGDGYAIDFVKLLVNVRDLSQKGTITGVVKNATGDLIKGAKIEAGGTTTYTDEAGKYTLIGVPAGLVVVKASASGYEVKTSTNDLKKGQTITVDFLLTGGTTVEPNLPFYDNFDRTEIGSNWQIIDAPTAGASNWKITDGVLMQNSNGYASQVFLGSNIIVGGKAWTNYTVTSTITPIDNDGLGVIVRYQNESNYYRFFAVQDSANEGPFMRIEKIQNGVFTILAEKKEFTIGDNTKVQVSCNGNQITARINGAVILNATDSSFSSGKAGFTVYAESGIKFDNVAIEKYTDIPNSITVELKSDKNIISANGQDTATLTVVVKDAAGGILQNQVVDIYVNETKITGTKFTASKEGSYSIKAVSGGVESNTIIISATSTNGNAIISTKQGGKWGDKTTWVYGVVPTANDDVIIDGPVSMEGELTCNNITVNTGSRLTNTYYASTFNITGNLINNGQIDGHDYGYSIRIGGNFYQNGTYGVNSTEFNGKGDQIIATATGKTIPGNYTVTVKGKILRANSDINTASTSIELAGGTLDMNNNKLNIMTGAFEAKNGKVTNISGINEAKDTVIYNTTFENTTNPITLTGEVRGEGTTTVNGGFIVSKGTLLTNNYYNWNLIIQNSLVNNGTINAHDYGFTISIGKDFDQSGAYNVSGTTFTGTGQQILHTAEESQILGNFAVNSSTAVLKANGNLNFNNFKIELNGAYIDMAGAGIKLVSGQFFAKNGKVKNITAINSTDAAIVYDTTFENINKATIYVTGFFKGEGSTTFDASIDLTKGSTFTNSYYAWNVDIKGSFVNNGNTYAHDYGFVLKIGKDFDQSGSYNVSSTTFTSTGEQVLKTAKDSQLLGNYFVESPTAVFKANGNLNFNNFKIELNNGYIDMNGAGINLVSGQFTARNGKENGKVKNITAINTTDAAIIYDTTFENTNDSIVYVTGFLKGEGTTKFDASLDLASDAVLTNSYYAWNVEITGDFTNNGKTYAHDYGFNLIIGKGFSQFGTYTVSGTTFNGKTEQKISCDFDSVIQGIYATDVAGKVLSAMTDINFTSMTLSFKESGTIDMNHNNVALKSGALEIKSGKVINLKSFTAEKDTVLYNSNLGNSSTGINLYGKVRGEGETTFEGDVTLNQGAELTNNYYGWGLTITGTFTNYGDVTTHDYGFSTAILKDFKQNGNYSVASTSLNGKTIQTISTGANNLLQGTINVNGEGREIDGSGNLNFKNLTINYTGKAQGILNMNGSGIVLKDGNILIKNSVVTGISFITGTESSIIYDSSFSNQNGITLNGNIRGEGSTTFNNSVTLSSGATLKNNYYGWNITINGEFTNNGKVWGSDYGLTINGKKM